MSTHLKTAFRTPMGAAYCTEAMAGLRATADSSVDLVITSPPYPLQRGARDMKGLEDGPPASMYVDWFCPFAKQIHRVLKPSGSFVLDIGGSWVRQSATRELYVYELPIVLCREAGFHLAQDFVWHNPTRLGISYWSARERTRVKDQTDMVYWFGKTATPKADNRRILRPYSEGHVKARNRKIAPVTPVPSRAKWKSAQHAPQGLWKDNGGSIPGNVLQIATAGGQDHAYIEACREKGLTPHPARFPRELPAFFIQFLTDPGDVVMDPFAGSATTGAVAEEMGRSWTAFDKVQEYLAGAALRFPQEVVYGEP